MVGSITSATFLSDSILFLRDSLKTNITDPISGTRDTTSSFVMTSYPQKKTQYPLITVKDNGVSDVKRLGMQSEQSWVSIPVEVKVWGRNMVELDSLSQSVYNFLQKNQFGTGSETINFGLHDFRCTSMINLSDIDENGKDTGIRAKQMIYQWKILI